MVFARELTLTLCAPIHISALGRVEVHARLILYGDGVARGTLEGLHFHNWDNEAIRVTSGRWVMQRCHLTSLYPRRQALSTHAIVMMHGSHLTLCSCHVKHCKHAVNILEPAEIRITQCQFEDMNASVRNVCGGGHVYVEECTFDRMKRAFHFDPQVSGHAIGNVMECEPFGEAIRPVRFQYVPPPSTSF